MNTHRSAEKPRKLQAICILLVQSFVKGDTRAAQLADVHVHTCAIRTHVRVSGQVCVCVCVYMSVITV